MEVEIFTGLVMLDSNSRIYLIKEEDKHEVGQGRWNLPGGGVDVGEGMMECAVREALEETGYEVELQSILGVYQGSKGESSWMFVVLEARIKSQKQKKVVDPDVKEGRWFSKEEFLALDDSLMVHPDMKVVYQAALEKKGLSLSDSKVIDFDKE